MVSLMPHQQVIVFSAPSGNLAADIAGEVVFSIFGRPVYRVSGMWYYIFFVCLTVCILSLDRRAQAPAKSSSEKMEEIPCLDLGVRACNE